MAINKQIPDQSLTFNSVYNITLDLSNWDKTTIQTVAPMAGVIFVYATNDSGAVQGVTQGNAQLATNFTSAEVTNLATHAVTNIISAAGTYKYDVNAQFLRLQGSPSGAGASIYKLLLNNQKIS